MSLGEQKFLEQTGLVSNTQKLPNHWKDLDSEGHGGHWVVPDCVVLDPEGNRCLIEYKHGNKLNTDGARKGKKSADKKKVDYLSNSFKGNYKSRLAYAESHLGWNHSLYKMIGMKQIYDRVVVIDPKLNKHSVDPEYQRKVLQKGKAHGVEFMTICEFEDQFEGCLDVGVDRIVPIEAFN